MESGNGMGRGTEVDDIDGRRNRIRNGKERQTKRKQKENESDGSVDSATARPADSVGFAVKKKKN